jgi:hypothetical protein
VCLPANRPPRSIDEVDQALLELTPLRYLRVFGVPFTEPVQVLDELSAHQGEYESPFFLFAHIGSPHFPYRYERSCVARDVPRDAHQLDPEDRVTAYVQDARCLNALVIGAVDRILESDPDAIIVLQSDHGSNFLLDWALPLDEWSDAALQERYSVLNAVHLPDRCEGEIEGVSLVNTFRIVFACIEGLDEPDLLVDRHFLSPYDQVSGVVEIPPERIQEPG